MRNGKRPSIMRSKNAAKIAGILMFGIGLVYVFFKNGETVNSSKPKISVFDLLKKDASRSQGYVPLAKIHDSQSVEVHVCIAAAGKEAIKELIFELKSMFWNARNSDIFLHFLTDSESEEGIHHFMSSVKNVSVRLHYETVILNEDFIKNETSKLGFVINHHSGVFGMSKLFFFKIWNKLDRCIILDTDLIFAHDVAFLWAEFERMSSESIIMMITDEQPYNCNSGVMLQDYNAMRKMNFTQYCAERIEKYCTPLQNNPELYDCGGHGDQNLYHKIFLHHPQFYTFLNRSWNLEYCHQFSGFNFNTFNSPSNQLFFGIAHFNCFPGDDYVKELYKIKSTTYQNLINYIEHVEKISPNGFNLGNESVKRIL